MHSRKLLKVVIGEAQWRITLVVEDYIFHEVIHQMISTPNSTLRNTGSTVPPLLGIAISAYPPHRDCQHLQNENLLRASFWYSYIINIDLFRTHHQRFSKTYIFIYMKYPRKRGLSCCPAVLVPIQMHISEDQFM